MRSMIKRLLKKYKYPPEGQKTALELVLKQAELMSEQMPVYEINTAMAYAADEKANYTE
jgi:type I restriction enzyme, R subunit